MDAKVIKEVVGEFLERDKAKELFHRLSEAPVGCAELHSALKSLSAVYEDPPKPNWKLLWAFRLLVAFHLYVVVGNFLVILLIPFFTRWYVALPIESLLINLMFAPNPCPLTKLENNLRKRLGMPEIRHFVGHYIVWPVKKRFRKPR